MKLMPLKFDGQCANCGKSVPAGISAYYGKKAGKGYIRCTACGDPNATAGNRMAPPAGATPDCAGCPSFVAADDTRELFGRDIGADVCFRHTDLLSRPGQSPDANERIREMKAGKCADYMKDRPSSATLTPSWVALPDPTVKMRDASTQQPPSSCTQCEHFLSPATTRKELGWSLGLCAAKGQAMFPSNYTAEAMTCVTGVVGPQRDTSDGIMLMPEYDGNASSGSHLGATAKRAAYDVKVELARHAGDPREYQTDRPVQPNEKGVVRAWRQVNDPEGLRDPVFMPIFEGEKLCGFDPRETYGSHRPDLYIDHQSLLYDFAVEFFELDEIPLCQGGAGTGKTEWACRLAYLMDIPLTRISIEKGTESYHLMGDKELTQAADGSGIVTGWKHGRFSENYTKPGVIIIDEPNLKSEIMESLRPTFDNAKQLVLDGAQGIVIQRGPQTFLMLAQNPADDPIYVGTEPMNAADIDRVSPFAFDLPPENIERDIITAHCDDMGYDIPAKTLDQIMQIATDIRRQIASGDLSIAWGLRSQIKVARKTRFYSVEKAYRRAVLDGLDPDSTETITQSVRAVVA